MEPTRGKSICVPFDSAEHYAACVPDPESFRQHLMAVCGQHPELFPASISEGFVLHDKRWSVKQQVMLRRLALKATDEVFLVTPSFLMPYMVGRTEAVEKALYLRHWGVPFDALVYVCGRNAMCWYRAELALGPPTIVRSTVKQPEQLPAHVLADEKHTWALGHEVYVATTGGGGCTLGATAPAAASARPRVLADEKHAGPLGHEVYVATTVGGGCILGATVTEAASADALEAAYGEFAQGAHALSPPYSPKTVRRDARHGR